MGGSALARSSATAASAAGREPATFSTASRGSVDRGSDTDVTPFTFPMAVTASETALVAAGLVSCSPLPATNTTVAVALFWELKRWLSRSYACWESVPGTRKLLESAFWLASPRYPTTTSTASQTRANHRWWRDTNRPIRPRPLSCTPLERSVTTEPPGVRTSVTYRRGRPPDEETAPGSGPGPTP